MRVLNLISEFGAGGGIEAYLLRLFAAIDRTNLDIQVCHFAPRPGAWAERAEKLGVPVWGCTMGRNPYPFIRRLEAELHRRGPYDVVHTHPANLGGPALEAARRAGVPTRIAHYHNTRSGHNYDFKRRLYEWFVRRWVVRSATAIAGCSWAALEGFHPERWNRDPRMFVVRYGLPMDKFTAVRGRDEVRGEFNIPSDAAVVGHIGSFFEQKNHARLVQVAAEVVKQRPKTHFLLIGDGALRPAITQQVRELGIEKHVTFTGIRDDIPRLLSAMDLFTLPSLWEGYGIVLLEAQAAKLPVLVTQIPAAKEAVCPLFHEYFRDPLDVPGMSAAMLALLERALRDPTLGERASEFARRFTIEQSCEAMRAAWKLPGAQAPPDPAGFPAPR